MRNKIAFAFLTLMLCMGVFPVTAFAQNGGEYDTHYNNFAEHGEYDDYDGYDWPYYLYDKPYPYWDADTDETLVTESAIPIGSGYRPFTPSGTGTIIDNATDDDGKEFYTIMTEDDSVFFLIIDRHRATDNVYFLNFVTEQDLISLALQNGRTITGSTTIEIPPVDQQPDENCQGSDEETEQVADVAGSLVGSLSNIQLLLLLFAAAGVVISAYAYYKIIKSRKSALDDDIYDENGEGDDDEYGYEDEPDY